MITPGETAVHDIVLAEVVHGRIATLTEAKSMAEELIAARRRHRQAEAKDARITELEDAIRDLLWFARRSDAGEVAERVARLVDPAVTCHD